MINVAGAIFSVLFFLFWTCFIVTMRMRMTMKLVRAKLVTTDKTSGHVCSVVPDTEQQDITADLHVKNKTDSEGLREENRVTPHLGGWDCALDSITRWHTGCQKW